ncbi:MAG: ribonuclease III [Puniceicoccaceae bacterium]
MTPPELSMEPPLLEEIERILGHRFQNPFLIQTALRHVSTHRNTPQIEHNQRLEFLGDAVLGLIVGTELYQRFPEDREGLLSRKRASLVNQQILANIGRAIGLPRFLVLAPEVVAVGGANLNSTLADTIEAIIGALYLDAGLEPARNFVLRFFDLDSSPDLQTENPKGALQETIQSKDPSATIEYCSTRLSGPDHAPRFEATVLINGIAFGKGSGSTKKTAESAAAEQALSNLPESWSSIEDLSDPQQTFKPARPVV